MSEHNITVEGGSSVRLPTAGKYCDRDIVVTATGGGGGIPDGYYNASGLNVDESKVLAGEIYIDEDGYKIGEMPDNGAVNSTIQGLVSGMSTPQPVTIPEGYHNGQGKVSISSDVKTLHDNIAQALRQKGQVVSLNYDPKHFPTLIGGIQTSEDLNAVLTEQETLIEELKEELRGKAAGGGGENDVLPSGYVLVPSIKFTGEQAVNTGIICNQDTQIRIAFTRDAENLMYVYGVTNDANTASITGYCSSSGYWRFGNQKSSLATPADEKMVWGVKVNKNRILRGNAEIRYNTVNDFTTERALMLGGREITDGVIEEETLLVGKIVAFDLYNGDELVLSFVPCKDANGVCGFWDKVSGRFFASATNTPLEWSFV